MTNSEESELRSKLALQIVATVLDAYARRPPHDSWIPRDQASEDVDTLLYGAFFEVKRELADKAQALSAALRRHGAHSVECHIDGDVTPCDCGFSAALSILRP